MKNELFFKKRISMLNFLKEYGIDNEGFITSNDLKCDGCKKVSYMPTEYIFFTFKLNGYCENCFNTIQKTIKEIKKRK